MFRAKREIFFLDPAHSLGITAAARHVGVFALFARDNVSPDSESSPAKHAKLAKAQPPSPYFVFSLASLALFAGEIFLRALRVLRGESFVTI